MTRPGLTRERLGGLFLLGLLLLAPPLLGAVDRPRLMAGIPMLYLFLYLAWALLIGLVALIVERSAADDELVEDAGRAEDETGSDTRTGS